MSTPRAISRALAASVLVAAAACPSLAAADTVDHGVGAQAAWDEGYTGSGTAVAVVDTGVDTLAPWFSSTTAQEACFGLWAPDLSANCLDRSGVLSFGPVFGLGAAKPPPVKPVLLKDVAHGHAVAGVAVGAERRVDDVASGARGIAPDANLVAINAAAIARDDVSVTAVSEVLKWLIDQRAALGVTVVNLSLSRPLLNQPLPSARNRHCDAEAAKNPFVQRQAELIEQLDAAGVVVVAAAGNEAVQDMEFPACLSRVVAVGGTENGRDEMWKDSNRSTAIDVLAPAIDVRAPVLGTNSIRPQEGTSFAAPQVAGAVALYRQQNPFATPAEIRKRLRNTGPLVQVRRSVQRRRLDISHLLDLKQELGAIDSGCFSLRIPAAPGKPGYRMASVRLTCAPSVGRPDRLLVVVDGTETGFTLSATFRTIPIQPDRYYRDTNVVFNSPAFRIRKAGVYRTCWLLFGANDPTWPAASECRYDDL